MDIMTNTCPWCEIVRPADEFHPSTHFVCNSCGESDTVPGWWDWEAALCGKRMEQALAEVATETLTSLEDRRAFLDFIADSED